MTSDDSSAAQVKAIQLALLTWFRDFGRDFPWRQIRDPFQVLLAEKLLQQTSVRGDTIRIYQHLVSIFPDAQTLAKADVGELHRLISPLGLHYRAKEMVILAQEIVDKYNGIIPNDLRALISLTGVGDYSARAVLCFAYGEDVPIVDTNVARILYRVFALPGKMPSNPARKRDLIHLAASLVPATQSQYFNWALLDLGSSICKASNPRCNECPLQNLCQFNLARKEKK